MKKRLLKIVNKYKKIIKKQFNKFLVFFKKKIKLINSFLKKLVKDKKKNSENKKKEKKFDYNTLTINQIESELNKTKYNEKYLKILKSTIYSLIIIVSVALIIATLVMPVFQISTSSMSGTYDEGDIVVSFKTKNVDTGDVIAFYHGNKILVKRVIATSGSWVVIDDEGNIFVDGKVLDEPYLEEKKEMEYNIEIPYQVPDGSWFVLSDRREDMIDSRNSEVGSVSEDDLIGKILFRIWPLNKRG